MTVYSSSSIIQWFVSGAYPITESRYISALADDSSNYLDKMCANLDSPADYGVYGGFDWSIPAGATIVGARIDIEAQSFSDLRFYIIVSNDSGQTWGKAIETPTIESDGYEIYSVGGPTELWDLTWNDSLENYNWKMKVNLDVSYTNGCNNSGYVDYIKGYVFYTNDETPIRKPITFSNSNKKVIIQKNQTNKIYIN